MYQIQSLKNYKVELYNRHHLRISVCIRCEAQPQFVDICFPMIDGLGCWAGSCVYAGSGRRSRISGAARNGETFQLAIKFRIHHDIFRPGERRIPNRYKGLLVGHLRFNGVRNVQAWQRLASQGRQADPRVAYIHSSSADEVLLRQVGSGAGSPRVEMATVVLFQG